MGVVADGTAGFDPDVVKARHAPSGIFSVNKVPKRDPGKFSGEGSIAGIQLQQSVWVKTTALFLSDDFCASMMPTSFQFLLN